MKAKRCKSCRESFIPARPLQSACGVQCAIALTNAGKEKARKAKEARDRQEHRAAKELIKTKGEHAKEAQAAFNEFIRLRDKDLPCISCGRFHEGQWHAGHFRSVGGNPELRFHEHNVHKQCAPCNNHMSGNIVNYRINLAERVGQFVLRWLEGPHEPKRYTIEELKAIKAEYRAKVRELKGKDQ